MRPVPVEVICVMAALEPIGRVQVVIVRVLNITIQVINYKPVLHATADVTGVRDLQQPVHSVPIVIEHNQTVSVIKGTSTHPLSSMKTVSPVRSRASTARYQRPTVPHASGQGPEISRENASATTITIMFLIALIAWNATIPAETAPGTELVPPVHTRTDSIHHTASVLMATTKQRRPMMVVLPAPLNAPPASTRQIAIPARELAGRMSPQHALAWTGTTIPEPVIVLPVSRAVRIVRPLPVVSATPTEI